MEDLKRSSKGSKETGTHLAVIATVSRVVTMAVDRVTGDRVDCPLLVAAAVQRALKNLGIEGAVMYGQAAWIEILNDETPVWAGCWGDNYSFWVATEFGEVVDLNVSAAHRKRSHSNPKLQAKLSAPMLWSREVPAFYRYVPEGMAELDISDERDRRHMEVIFREIDEKCRPEWVLDERADTSFANEPIVCPGRRILDDSHDSFKHFDRALAVGGIPPAPI